MPTTLIAGYYGFGNAGDELVLHALLRKVRHESPDESTVVMSNDPGWTQDVHKTKAVNRWQIWDWILPLMRSHQFILGGGGLLQESTGHWNHFYYLSLVVLAKCFGCHTRLVSLGVDPIQHPFNRFLTRWVCHHFADDISVRDAVSYDALRGAGVVAPLHIQQDLVFELPIATATVPKDRIAFALSPQAVPSVEAVAEFLQAFSQRTSIPVDLLILYPHQDEGFARHVAALSGVVEHIRVVHSPIDLLSWVPTYRMVVASRFHALVLASSARCPFIGWGNQNKVATLCASTGQPYTNTVAHWNADQLLNQLESLLAANPCLSPNKIDILARQTD